MSLLKPTEYDAATIAADHVSRTHHRLAEMLRPGLTLANIDGFIARTLEELGSRSAFLRYAIPGLPPFPSHSCLSLNDCIVHGTHLMTDRPLVPGDILSIDIGVQHAGWIGDAAWTYAIESASDDALALMRCGRESLRRGVETMIPGRPLMDWARTVQTCVEDDGGYHLVRGLGGHGYGRKLHGSPFIANTVPKSRAEWPDAWTSFKPGMLLAVEPMLAIGTAETSSEPRRWPIFTADGSLSVHYEADVLITPEGPRNLTASMFDLPDIVG